MAQDLLGVISHRMPKFSKGQRQIARYIAEHYDKAAFMTASRLGATVGVSESTVVRFAAEIGYEGYPQLQRALQELIRNRLTAVQRMEIVSDQIGEDSALPRVLGQDIEKIRRTLEELSQEEFSGAVETILGARRIYIVGVRSSAALAVFLSFYFNQMFENVRAVNTTSISEMFEQIFRIEPGDVLIPISFPRYSQRTVKAAQYAREKGASVVALTDTVQSPIATLADYTLLARSDMVSFVDSLVAPLSVLNALIVAVGQRKKGEISKTYAALEHIWDEYNVYQKAEPGHI